MTMWHGNSVLLTKTTVYKLKYHLLVEIKLKSNKIQTLDEKLKKPKQKLVCQITKTKTDIK